MGIDHTALAVGLAAAGPGNLVEPCLGLLLHGTSSVANALALRVRDRLGLHSMV